MLISERDRFEHHGTYESPDVATIERSIGSWFAACLLPDGVTSRGIQLLITAIVGYETTPADT